MSDGKPARVHLDLCCEVKLHFGLTIWEEIDRHSQLAPIDDRDGVQLPQQADRLPQPVIERDKRRLVLLRGSTSHGD